MTDISLNITGKIDSEMVAILGAVNTLAAELAMNYVVVGATARDMVLHHGYGAKIQRVTVDVDFAIEVPDWGAFEAIKNGLSEQGFSETRNQHRLISPKNMVIDIVPFGGVEDESAKIGWPPDGDIVMNMLGFQEACESAEWVRIHENPDLDIPVVTPVGMTLLKLIAWTDRAKDKRKRDAEDMAYLLRNYEEIPAIGEALYGNVWEWSQGEVWIPTEDLGKQDHSKYTLQEKYV